MFLSAEAAACAASLGFVVETTGETPPLDVGTGGGGDRGCSTGEEGFSGVPLVAIDRRGVSRVVLVNLGEFIIRKIAK